MVYYRIATTAFGSDRHIHVKFKDFINDSPIACSNYIKMTEVKSISIDHKIENYTKEGVFWRLTDEGLNVNIWDDEQKRIDTKLTFIESYKSSILFYLENDKFSYTNNIDISLFIYFQVRLLFASGICLHASAIEWQGKGILFSAQSETGKTTQSKMWVKNENAEIINGDRPALTINGSKVEVHGTPWSGSDPIIRNISVPVKCIVMLEQSSTNEVFRLTPNEALNWIFPRFFLPYFDEQLMDKALNIVSEIIKRVPIYKLKCLPELGAVEVLKKELSLLEE